MSNSIIENILKKIGLTTEDLPPIQVITVKALNSLAMVLNTKPDQLTIWSKEMVASYASNEWAYLVYGKDNQAKAELAGNAQLLDSLSTLVAEKFILINLKPSAFQSQVSAFSAVSSTAEAVLSKMHSINVNLSLKDPSKTLIPDLFDKIIKEAIGIVKMLNLGLANDAYGSWRTLHEAECVVKLLLEGGQELQQVYLKHIVYNNAFRDAIGDVETTDSIFAQMKGEMKEHGLKSKDMKKYIEYGWLYSSPTFDNDDPNYKLNFRDGVQKAARLSKYTIWYEAASELSHSSPVFFYSSEEYFLELATIGLYDVLERVEEMFYQYVGQVHPELLSELDNKARMIIHGEMKRVALDRRLLFQNKYKEAALYDEEEI